MIKYTKDQARVKNASITRFYVMIQMHLLLYVLGPALKQFGEIKRRSYTKPVPTFQSRNGT